MKPSSHPRRNRTPYAPRTASWRPAVAAFLATLLAVPVHAGIVIPDDPLTTGVRVASNVLFILDDSGSMAFDYMPDSVPKTSTVDVSRRAYPRNTLSYNPFVEYKPWMKPDGTRMTGGTSYDAVYGSFNLVGGSTIDLSNPSSCRDYNYNSNATTDEGVGTKVCGAVQTFYVPIDPNDGSTFESVYGYYRYQIFEDGAIVRSQYGARAGSSPDYNRGLSGRNCSTGSGDNWRNCTRVTPSGRSEEAERTNYATWFSYHRTRIKSAKAGASEAFLPLGKNVRVGFRTIWQRGPNHSTPIPVTKGDGLFINDPASGVSNRNDWYNALFATIGYNGTPLKGALYQAGKYFESDANTGPYGPQAKKDQLSCRQNFAILTTDGYWNNDSNYTSVNEQDNSGGATITGPGNKSYSYVARSPFASSDSNTLADVAMHFWKRDLRSDLENNVPASAPLDSPHPKYGNPAFWQHMVTFGISIGLTGTRGWGSVDEVPANASWPNPNDHEDNERIDDLLHAAVNGHGAFVAANRPEEFAKGLADALATIVRRTSSYSNVAVNSVSLDTGAQVFSATYLAGAWTGSVAARNLTSGGLAATPAWTSTLPAWGSRRIFTYDGSSGTTFPTSTQVTALERTGGPVNYPVSGLENANYLKGKQDLEGEGLGRLRKREGVLGDIVNSSPAFVKDTNSLYVGANDGMLHAFNAANGQELFAYVPNLLNFRQLSELSRGDYTHRFFVDGPIAVSERSLTPGKNILVGTLGRGGKGLFALDVSTPASFGAGNVLWERGDTSNGHMGLVLGKPIMGRVPGGQNAVIIGNGPNSTSNQAALIVLDLQTGAVIHEISTGVGSASSPNGLFKPVGVFGPDRKTLQYVYAGDMQGNVWKFNLTDGTFIKLFSTGGKPITSGVTTAIHPLTRERWIFFGTGRFLTSGDAAPPFATQSMYGFVDRNTAFTEADLTLRSFAVTDATSNGKPVRAFAASAALPAGSKGWYVNLPGNGERIVQDPQIASGFLVTASMIPSNDGCGADGSGYINAVDAFTGTSGVGGSFFDLDGDGSTSDEVVGSDNLPIGSVDLGVGMPTLPNVMRERLVVGGTSDRIGVPPRRSLGWNRVSWREIRKD